MTDRTLAISVGGQPVGVSFDEERIDVAVANETIHVHTADGEIRFLGQAITTVCRFMETGVFGFGVLGVDHATR